MLCFCLYCDAWSCMCSCMRIVSVSSCRCCMSVSSVHPQYCILHDFLMCEFIQGFLYCDIFLAVIQRLSL